MQLEVESFLIGCDPNEACSEVLKGRQDIQVRSEVRIGHQDLGVRTAHKYFALMDTSYRSAFMQCWERIGWIGFEVRTDPSGSFLLLIRFIRQVIRFE